MTQNRRANRSVRPTNEKQTMPSLTDDLRPLFASMYASKQANGQLRPSKRRPECWAFLRREKEKKAALLFILKEENKIQQISATREMVANASSICKNRNKASLKGC